MNDIALLKRDSPQIDSDRDLVFKLCGGMPIMKTIQ